MMRRDWIAACLIFSFLSAPAISFAQSADGGREIENVMPQSSGMGPPAGDRMNPAASAPGSLGRLDSRAGSGAEAGAELSPVPGAEHIRSNDRPGQGVDHRALEQESPIGNLEEPPVSNLPR